MRESFTGNVEINNMAPDVLENLLSYIYTCNAPSIDRLSRELLAAADQYQVGKLKALCEMKLCAEIGIENCVHLLMLGDMHQAFTLKTQDQVYTDLKQEYHEEIARRISQVSTDYDNFWNTWQQKLVDHYKATFKCVPKFSVPLLGAKFEWNFCPPSTNLWQPSC